MGSLYIAKRLGVERRPCRNFLEMELSPPPGVLLRKDVISGELVRVFAQGCESKEVRGDVWCGRVGSGVIRIA